MADRTASAVWEGNLFEGKGQVRFDSSQALGPVGVSWPSRTEEPSGNTSPEELIAAAHSACFSMAFSNQLAQRGHAPERLETSATVSLEKRESGMTITRSAITVRAVVPGIDQAAFDEAAQAAKAGCPVSRALAGNLEITLDAQLAS